LDANVQSDGDRGMDVDDNRGGCYRDPGEDRRTSRCTMEVVGLDVIHVGQEARYYVDTSNLPPGTFQWTVAPTRPHPGGAYIDGPANEAGVKIVGARTGYVQLTVVFTSDTGRTACGTKVIGVRM
jgi:hypothetical protein